jgi:hypothetical protein
MNKEHRTKDNFYGKLEASKKIPYTNHLKRVHLFMRRICYYQSMNTFYQNSPEYTFLRVS